MNITFHGEADFLREIAEAERRRCEALVSADIQGLAALLADGLVHIHTSGRRETKDEYLANVGTRIRYVAIERIELEITGIAADCALTTGTLRQTIRRANDAQDVVLHCCIGQVWQRTDGLVQQCFYQATKIV